MSEHTASAAGAAMPAEGPDPNLEHRLDILHIENNLNEVRHLLEAVFMAVDSLEIDDQQAALHALINVAQHKLGAAIDKLTVARGGSVQ